MIQRVNDVAYATRENIEGGFSAVGMATDILKYSFAMDTLKMLKGAPRTGYYVPWTASRLKNRGFKDLRVKSGYRPNPLEQQIDRFRAGLRSKHGIGKRGVYFGGALPRQALRSGVQRTGGAAAKMFISRMAGIGIPVANIAMWGPLFIAGGSIAYQALDASVTKWRNLEMGGYFADSPGAYTSRQRAVQAITASHLQAKSSIGNEAMLFHR